MLTLDKINVILWEAESIINNIVIEIDHNNVDQIIENYMQEESFYGDPDFSYY
jgi:hypothetical protein